jgi:hypothetical protein
VGEVSVVVGSHYRVNLAHDVRSKATRDGVWRSWGGQNTETFASKVAEARELTWLVHRYTQAFVTQIGQQVACNGLHTIEERCARWMLLTHDRVGSDEFARGRVVWVPWGPERGVLAGSSEPGTCSVR